MLRISVQFGVSRRVYVCVSLCVGIVFSLKVENFSLLLFTSRSYDIEFVSTTNLLLFSLVPTRRRVFRRCFTCWIWREVAAERRVRCCLGVKVVEKWVFYGFFGGGEGKEIRRGWMRLEWGTYYKRHSPPPTIILVDKIQHDTHSGS